MMVFRSIDDVGPVSPLASSLAAGFSGAVAAAASHTFDTAKSRSQCIVMPKVCILLVVDLMVASYVLSVFLHVVEAALLLTNSMDHIMFA